MPRFIALLLIATSLALPGLAKAPSPAEASGLTVVDWSQIRAEYERHRHGMFPEAGGFQARSVEQQWLAHFDGRGVSVAPDEGAWSWGLELTGVDGQAKVSTDVNRITYTWGADLDEWFVNSTRGLEHGFTLKSPRQIQLAVRGSLQARSAGTSVEFVDASGAARVRYSGLAAWDAEGRTLPARMTVQRGLVTIVVDDRGARYPVTIDPIAQQAFLKASNAGAVDSFGYSTAISGDTVVVGTYLEESRATGINGNQADNSGFGNGAAYVFVRNAGVWTQQAYLKGSNTEDRDRFGWALAISGDTLVVGALGESSSAKGVNGGQADNSATSSGAAYVFTRSGTTWTQQAYLKASNTREGDQFGWSVGVSGDTIAVGAAGESNNASGVNGNQTGSGATSSGSAYVFVRSGNTWTQQAYLKASNTTAQALFGQSIAVAGDTVVVGSANENSGGKGVNGTQTGNGAPQSGSAYVFVRNGVTWTQQAYLKASNTAAGNLFGVAVAVSGDTIVVGSDGESSNGSGVNGNQNDNSATFSGSAYVFVRVSGTWTQQAYLKASNAGASDFFGQSVAIFADTVVVGATGEASNATGVNGNQGDNSVSTSGAAYVFVRSGVTWTQLAYLKASAAASNNLGVSVAVSGDTVVVGANHESSTALNSGAAYVFTGFPFSPPLDVQSAADYRHDGLAPLSISLGIGTGLATDTLVASSPWPLSLLGASVRVKDSAGVTRTAPMVYIFPLYVSFLIPEGSANGTATVEVVRSGVVISSGTTNISAVSPGFFTANASGSGAASAIVLHYSGDTFLSYEYSFTCPSAGACVPSTINMGPPTERVILSLYGTGIRGRTSQSAVTATAGGVNLDVLYAGLQGTIDGMDQVNLLLPRSLIGKGLLTLNVTVDGKAANAVEIRVQ